MSILNQVLPQDLHDNTLYKSCTLVTNPALGTKSAMPAYIGTLNGEPSAIAIESIAPDGYSGAIKIIVGVKQDGTIIGVRVLSQHETPGLVIRLNFVSQIGFWNSQVKKSHSKTYQLGK